MNQLALSFFGTFQASLDGQPVTNFRSAKIQGLLIYLVLTAQQRHTRDELAALFWPDEPEKTAKQNLRVSLHRLRQLLGETDSGQFLLITRSTAQFDPDSN
jgi:DNA-binding SARP family transcriptional activator